MTDYKRTDNEIREEVKKEVLGVVRRYTATANAWRAIKRKHKKDGGDFANLKQNFEATDGVRLHWDTTYGKEDLTLTIYYKVVNEEGREIEDTLYTTCYKNVSQHDADYNELKAQGRIRERGEWLHDFYTLNADELEQIFVKGAEEAEARAKSLDENMDAIVETGVKAYHLTADLLDLKYDLEERKFGDLGNGHFAPVARALQHITLDNLRYL